MNYLKDMLEDERHNIIFVGYQANGTPGRDIQNFGKQHGYVELDGECYTINAEIETIGGYSAHADQGDLLNFIRSMDHNPKILRIVHGDGDAKNKLKKFLKQQLFLQKIVVPTLFDRYLFGKNN